MIRLLYISTARTMLGDRELEAVLRTSRRNNAAAGVTGLLVVGGRRFLQALEGPEDAVVATYDRIRSDPRHFAIAQLGRAAISERAFGSWAMGSQRGGAATADAAPMPAVEALIAPIDDPSLRAYFSGFAELHRAA